jgi:hypothetical protein
MRGVSYISDTDFSDILFKKTRISFCTGTKGHENAEYGPGDGSNTFSRYFIFLLNRV